MKTQALKIALSENKYDLAFGGQDEMKKNQEQRKGFFHLDQKDMSGTPRSNDLSFGITSMQEKSRRVNWVFPLSNWTELDITIHL